MRAIIAGFGRVGSRTARVLDEEGHDVTLVETVREKAERAEARGFAVVHGDATEAATLATAGADTADAVAGLTGDPATNAEICSLTTDHGCRTVMRLSEDLPGEIYEEYEAAVDEVIYPERLGAAGAKTALLGGNFNALAALTADLQLTTVTVTDDAPVVGRRINDLDVDGARVYAHSRQRESLTIPLPGTVIEPADRLAVIVEGERIDAVREALLGVRG
ncbi:MAG: K+ transport system, NAD-binding component [halophilic archaeon J07HB67]|jgi:K+ transport systems, NAD-binding component|nr:MAG: K+ transport system, NAD-binding component [halophilic archaeon J07HB67]